MAELRQIARDSKSGHLILGVELFWGSTSGVAESGRRRQPQLRREILARLGVLGKLASVFCEITLARTLALSFQLGTSLP